MRRFMLGMAISAIATLSPSLVMAGDQEVAQRIANTLKTSGRMVDYSVAVKYQDGTAWLMGRVSSRQQMAEALAIAKKLPEVSEVVNNLSIEAKGSKAQQPRKLPATRSTGKGNILRTPVVRSAEEQQDEIDDSDASLEEEEEVLNAVHQATFPETEEDALTEEAGPVIAPVRRASTGKRMVRNHMRPTANQQGVAPAQLPAQQDPRLQARGQQVRQQPQAQGQGNRRLPRPFARLAQRNGASQYNQGRAPARVARQVEGEYDGYDGYSEGGQGAPMPTYMPTSSGVAPAHYDQAHMPNYAWPSYAAYPNYAGVTYPKQYSPTAWPFIGPFYPYPQVPLGWRKVTLEWDDGWWMLDFDD